MSEIACFQQLSRIFSVRSVDSSSQMEAANRAATLRIWILGGIAALFSIACAFSYFFYMAQGIVVGALLGLPGREGDVAIAQHWAAHWFVTSLFCLIASALTATAALPVYAGASRVPRLVARFILASLMSVAFSLLIGIAAFSVIAAFHRVH
jgi:hypothetical protein